MTSIAALGRVGAAAFGLGLWLVGQQAAGVARADSGGEPDIGPAGHRAAAHSAAAPGTTAGHTATRGPRRHGSVASVPLPAAEKVPAPELPQTSPGPAPLAQAAVPTPPGVVAIPQTPLVTALRLQEIPLIGPLMVTPVVNLVNHIPVVSDVLHPVLGYPLAPTGTAAPRDVRVISFDGTPINAHFMPATGLPAGDRAPTVFLAPALGTPGATNVDGTPFDLILSDLGGEVGVADLRNAGFNVVTWDPRGQYFSGGRVEIDSPDFEARVARSAAASADQKM